MGGEVRGPGPRSLEALRWIERLDAVGLDALGCAIGFGRRAGYSHVRRLEAEGLVRRVYDREGSLVAITPSGRRRARPDLSDRRCIQLGAVRSRAAHARATSWLAARATLRGQTWLSEREIGPGSGWLLTRVGGGSPTHRADLGVVVEGVRVAVEVELTAKAPTRLRAILSAYEDRIAAGALAGVAYVCDDERVDHAVRRAAAYVGLRDDVFRLMTLSQVVVETRVLGRERLALCKVGRLEDDESR